MRGAKPQEDNEIKTTNKEPWPWTYPSYTFKIDREASDIKALTIDASLRMADIDRSNNSFIFADNLEEFKDPTR